MKKVADVMITQAGIAAGLPSTEEVIFNSDTDSVRVCPAGSLIFEISDEYIVYAPGTWAFFSTRDE